MVSIVSKCQYIEPIQISCWTGKNLEIWRSVITTLSDIRTTTSCSLLMSGTNSRKTAWVFGKYFPRNLQWEFFSRQTKAFALFVRLLGSKTEQDAAECLPEQKPEVGFRLSFKGSHSPRKFTFFCCWKKSKGGGGYFQIQTFQGTFCCCLCLKFFDAYPNLLRNFSAWVWTFTREGGGCD